MILNFEQATALAMVLAICAVLIGALGKWHDYGNNKRASPSHDSHLHGFKLSFIIVTCAVVLILLIGTTGVTLVMAKRQTSVNSKIDFIIKTLVCDGVNQVTRRT